MRLTRAQIETLKRKDEAIGRNLRAAQAAEARAERYEKALKQIAGANTWYGAIARKALENEQ